MNEPLTIEHYLNKYHTRYGIYMAYIDEKMTLSEARLFEELWFHPEELKAYLLIRLYREVAPLLNSIQENDAEYHQEATKRI